MLTNKNYARYCAQFLIVFTLASAALHAQDPTDLRARIAALELHVAELEKQITEISARTKLLAMAADAAAPPKDSAPARSLTSWKGNGSKETESFTTRSSEFRIRWTIKPDGFIGIFVYDAATGKPVSSATGSKSDVTVVRTPPGKYYLKITGVDDWEIFVEQ